MATVRPYVTAQHSHHLSAATTARVAQMALALARMDNPRPVSTQPAAAKVLVALLDKLRSASAGASRGNLAVVRAMASRDLGTR